MFGRCTCITFMELSLLATPTHGFVINDHTVCKGLWSFLLFTFLARVPQLDTFFLALQAHKLILSPMMVPQLLAIKMQMAANTTALACIRFLIFGAIAFVLTFETN